MKLDRSPQLEPVQIMKMEKDDKKSKTDKPTPSIRFHDVAGLEEVKEELI